jgi:hypothetical protein
MAGSWGFRQRPKSLFWGVENETNVCKETMQRSIYAVFFAFSCLPLGLIESERETKRRKEIVFYFICAMGNGYHFIALARETALRQYRL